MVAPEISRIPADPHENPSGRPVAACARGKAAIGVWSNIIVTELSEMADAGEAASSQHEEFATLAA